jgi:hypothetical protein
MCRVLIVIVNILSCWEPALVSTVSHSAVTAATSVISVATVGHSVAAVASLDVVCDIKQYLTYIMQQNYYRFGQDMIMQEEGEREEMGRKTVLMS